MFEFLLKFCLTATAVVVIILVMLQRGKGGGLAGALGGMGGQSAFGTKAGDLFTKITIGVASFWILISVVAAIYAPRLGAQIGTTVQNTSQGQTPPGGEKPSEGSKPAEGSKSAPGGKPTDGGKPADAAGKPDKGGQPAAPPTPEKGAK